MKVWVKNQNFERVGLVEGFESLIWTKRYAEWGDFELYLPASAEVLSLLTQDRYLAREDDKSVMVIEKIEVATDAEDGNHLIVSGRSFESILNRRVVWNQVSYRGTAEGIIGALLKASFLHPTDSKRKVSGMSYTAVASDSGSIRMQFTGTNIYDAVSEICKTYGLGFRMGEDLAFTVYKGLDRSQGQSVNPRVIFSPRFDNLLSTDYYNDRTDYKTVVRIAGEGEGSQRVYRTYPASTEESGVDRRECFIDARDIQSETADGETLTPDEYAAELDARAAEEYSTHRGETSFSGEIEPSATFKYKEDYDLGDIVTVQNEYGMTENCRITEVIENWDSNGYKVIPKYERVM